MTMCQKPAEKLNKLIVPIELNSEQYAQICAKADHDLSKPEDIIQEAVEIYLEQLNGEKVVLDKDILLEGYKMYLKDGIDSEGLEELIKQHKFQ